MYSIWVMLHTAVKGPNSVAIICSHKFAVFVSVIVRLSVGQTEGSH